MFVGMGIGTAKRIMVMVDVGTDVIITIIIIETHQRIIPSQASGEIVVEAALRMVEERDDTHQATKTVGVEVPAVVEVQEDILQVLPVVAATLAMIETLRMEAVLPAAVLRVVEVALAVVEEPEGTKMVGM
jgi:hypothetical protein